MTKFSLWQRNAMQDYQLDVLTKRPIIKVPARVPVTTGKSVIFIYLHIALNKPIDTIAQCLLTKLYAHGAGFYHDT